MVTSLKARVDLHSLGFQFNHNNRSYQSRSSDGIVLSKLDKIAAQAFGWVLSPTSAH